MNVGPHDRVEQSSDDKAEGANGKSGTRKRPILVAVDLGAESCRVSLLQWIDEGPEIQVVHRFPNFATDDGISLRWNIGAICAGVEEGLRACAQLAPERIVAIGVDGWAVDYLRLEPDGKPVGNPFCYRDPRTVETLKSVHARIPPQRLYELTGVQILPLNTLYQLAADPEADQTLPWINVPEFVMHRLGARRVSEYTNATHTQLLGVTDHAWSTEIFSAAGLKADVAPELVRPGTDIGELQGPLTSLPEFHDTRLIAPACHDTASAIAGIPGQEEAWAFISSGTWSLVGCVLDSPCVSESARRANFSNEGGVGGKIYFLKNVNGMWLLRQCIEQWGQQGQVWTVEQLIAACQDLDPPEYAIDVDQPDLLLPGHMPSRINAQIKSAGRTPISEQTQLAPQFANLIFYSLAARYAAVLQDATNITGKTLKMLYVVGGGSRNSFLNQLTAKATGLEVLTGSTESTTIGNFAIQLAALEGSYSGDVGVSAKAVAKWAGALTAKPIRPSSNVRARNVDGTQLGIGEALA